MSGNTADISDNSIDKYSDNDDDDDPELLARELEAYFREQDDPDDGREYSEDIFACRHLLCCV